MMVLLVVNLFELGSVVLTLVELNGYFQQKLKLDFCNDHYTFSKLYFLYSLFEKVKINVT